MSSGCASRPSSACPSRARSSPPTQAGKRPGAEARSPPGQLCNLAGAVDFFVAVGNDELGRRTCELLQKPGFRVHAATRDEPQRRAFTYVDSAGERTITLMGEKLHPHGRDPLPWRELAEMDAVYFTAGDADALRAARQARVLVATARELPTLLEAQVQLDALVLSGRDPAETYEPGQLEPAPRLIVSTMGREGGTYVAGRALRLVRRRRGSRPGRERLRRRRLVRGGPRVRTCAWRRDRESARLCREMWSGGDDRTGRLRRSAQPLRQDKPRGTVPQWDCLSIGVRWGCVVGDCGLKWGDVEYPYGPAHASRRTRALSR